MRKAITTMEQVGVCRRRLLAMLGGEVRNARYGVCYNLAYLDGFKDDYIYEYYFVLEQSKDFPGALRFSDGRLKEWFLPFTPGFGMWEGPNLEQRKALIRHLLGKLATIEAALAT